MCLTLYYGKKNVVKNTQAFTYSIVEIRIQDSYISTDYADSLNEENLEFGVQLTFHLDDGVESIGVELDYSFYENENKIHSIKTLCIYKMPESDYLKLKNDSLKVSIFMELADITITHSRGLQSTIINDTILEGYYIPSLSKTQLRNLIKPATE